MSWRAAWTSADAKANDVLEHVCGEGFWEGGIAREVARQPAGTLLHVASSMPIRDLENFADRVPVVTANRGANGIDGTIASACGAALGFSGPVTALLGDLAFAHDVGSLITARALGVSLTLVVVDNGGGGIFDFLGIAAHERETVTRYFTTPQPIDVAAIAAAHGWAVDRVTSLPELRAALAKAGSGLRVIHAVVDRAHNLAQHRAATAAVNRSLEQTT